MADLKLLYVYDALCGWCYGFNPTLRAFAKTHGLGSQASTPHALTVDVLSGGMIRGEREGPLSEVAPYIRTAYKDVERRTGVEFGGGFLDVLTNGDIYMTSEPAAALLAWARERAPARQLDAAHELQRGIYHHGYGPRSEALARHLARALGLDEAAAVAALTDGAYRTLAERDFATTQRLGVRGFPALFVARAEGLVPIANGYTDAEVLAARLRCPPSSNRL